MLKPEIFIGDSSSSLVSNFSWVLSLHGLNSSSPEWRRSSTYDPCIPTNMFSRNEKYSEVSVLVGTRCRCWVMCWFCDSCQRSSARQSPYSSRRSSIHSEESCSNTGTSSSTNTHRPSVWLIAGTQVWLQKTIRQSRALRREKGASRRMILESFWRHIPCSASICLCVHRLRIEPCISRRHASRIW